MNAGSLVAGPAWDIATSRNFTARSANGRQAVRIVTFVLSVLISGGAGFIGCALARRLVDEGARVTVLDCLHHQVHPSARRPGRLPSAVDLLTLDVSDAESWRAALRVARPDTIVHLAAETGTGQSLHSASRHALVNVVGTTRMLDALSMCDHTVQHIVLASSRAVYGEGDWQLADGRVVAGRRRTQADLLAGRWIPAPGDAKPLAHRVSVTVPRPVSVYGSTKLTQEHLLTAWTAASDVHLSMLRLQNVYGPGQSLSNAYSGVLTLFARCALAGEAIEVFEDGNIVRDFVYIDDVVEALHAAIATLPTGAPRLLDIGSGRATTVLEVARAIADRAAAPTPVVSGRFRHGDVRAAWCNPSHAAKALGFQSAWSLEAGISALVEWVATQTPSLVDARPS